MFAHPLTSFLSYLEASSSHMGKNMKNRRFLLNYTDFPHFSVFYGGCPIYVDSPIGSIGVIWISEMRSPDNLANADQGLGWPIME